MQKTNYLLDCWYIEEVLSKEEGNHNVHVCEHDSEFEDKTEGEIHRN